MPTLPPEILLLIRAYVLANVTNHLIGQSCSALQRYENTLRHLLCTECRSYNEYIYGDDPWQWEQFFGACGCVRGRYFASLSFTPTDPSSLTSTPSLNPRQFIDRRQWLENYLSRKSLRFVSRRTLDQPPRSHHPIWSLVGDVLQSFQCTSIPQTGQLASLHPPTSSTGAEGNDVLIVPDVGSFQEGTLLDDWTTKLKLRRVERELALTAPCAPQGTSLSLPCISTTKSQPLLFPHSSHLLLPCNGAGSTSCISRTVSELFSIFCTVFFATIWLPLSPAMLLLKVVCWYCKPNVFILI